MTSRVRKIGRGRAAPLYSPPPGKPPLRHPLSRSSGLTSAMKARNKSYQTKATRPRFGAPPVPAAEPDAAERAPPA
jgi:hypothetical protein